MGDKVQTWRVVLATGEVREVVAEPTASGRWTAVAEGMGRGYGDTAKAAAWRALDGHMGVREILAPGEPTRAELTAEVAHLRAENATLRASTDAAVDGVRAMLSEALRVAREEGAAALRSALVDHFQARIAYLIPWANAEAVPDGEIGGGEMTGAMNEAAVALLIVQNEVTP